MPEPIIPRTVNLPIAEHEIVEQYRVKMGLRSWSKALLMIITEWQMYQAQGARKK